MSREDPLEGFRGREGLDQPTRDLLAAAGMNPEGGAYDAAKKMSAGDEVQRFLASAPGQVLLEDHDEVLRRLLLALTEQEYGKSKVKQLCIEYRCKALSFGLLLATVNEAEQVREQAEQEVLQDQPAIEPDEV